MLKSFEVIAVCVCVRQGVRVFLCRRTPLPPRSQERFGNYWPKITHFNCFLSPV